MIFLLVFLYFHPLVLLRRLDFFCSTIFNRNKKNKRRKWKTLSSHKHLIRHELKCLPSDAIRCIWYMYACYPWSGARFDYAMRYSLCICIAVFHCSRTKRQRQQREEKKASGKVLLCTLCYSSNVLCFVAKIGLKWQCQWELIVVCFFFRCSKHEVTEIEVKEHAPNNGIGLNNTSIQNNEKEEEIPFDSFMQSIRYKWELQFVDFECGVILRTTK